MFSLAISHAAFALTVNDSAWFLDSSKTVNYCISRANNFSATSADIADVVQWSILKWVTYIDEHKLNERAPQLKLARNFVLVPDCAAADLQFLFGIQNDKISEYKNQDFFHPISFARMTSLDQLGGWGKGIVWIGTGVEFLDPLTAKPVINWGDRVRLKAILLHEMGHVFGVGHVDRTIMRANILESVLTRTAADEYSLTHIEYWWELSSSNKSVWNSGIQYSDLGEMSAAGFVQLIGRAPQGSVRGQWLTDKNQIVVQDDLGLYVLNVNFVYSYQRKDNNPALFYAVRKNSTTKELESVNATRESFVKIGKLTTLSGQKMTIIVERNTVDRQLSIPNLFQQPCEVVAIPLHGSACFPIYPKDEG